MRALPPDDALYADTKHARLMSETLRSGALQDPRFEDMVMALRTLYVIDPRTASTKEKAERKTAVAKAAKSGLDTLFYMAELMSKDEARVLYETAASLAKMRLSR